MTPDSLAKMKELVAAATPGPWFDNFDHGDRDAEIGDVEFDGENGRTAICWIYWAPDDSSFIAAARTFIPEAIEEIEKLRQQHQILLDTMIRDQKFWDEDKAENEKLRLRIGVLESALGYYSDELHYPRAVLDDGGGRARRALDE